MKDGGQAFPKSGNYDEDQLNEFDSKDQDGMTLRDWFAGQALAGIIALDSDADPYGCARDAYLYADGMLRAREYPHEEQA